MLKTGWPISHQEFFHKLLKDPSIPIEEKEKIQAMSLKPNKRKKTKLVK
jgi:hypothetical protein